MIEFIIIIIALIFIPILEIYTIFKIKQIEIKKLTGKIYTLKQIDKVESVIRKQNRQKQMTDLCNLLAEENKEIKGENWWKHFL